MFSHRERTQQLRRSHQCHRLDDADFDAFESALTEQGRTAALVPSVLLLYFAGYWLQNAMLTHEFIRKTQLEADLVR